MLKVLGRKTSGNVQKVLFFLEQTGTEYEREDYGRQFGNTGGEYLALNPTAKVPTLLDGDIVIWESNTILRYLAKKVAPDLYASDPVDVTRIERWMDFLLAAINTNYVAGFKGSNQDEADRSPELAGQLKDLHSQMAILNGALEDNEFIALSRLPIADIALAPILGRCLNFPYDRPAMPALEAWFGRMSAMPSFVAATS